MIKQLANLIVNLDLFKEKVYQEFSEATEEVEILVLLAVLVQEFSFQRLIRQEIFLDYLAKFFDLISKTYQDQEQIDLELAGWKAKVWANNSKENPTLVKLACSAMICSLVRKQRAKGYFIPKEKLFVWLNKAWDLGANQRKNYDREQEGGVLTTVGMILDFGADLVMCGHENGFLTQSLKAGAKEDNEKDIQREERSVVIKGKPERIDTGKICPPGKDYCWICGYVDCSEAFLKNNKCPNPICPDPHGWDD